MNRQLDDRQGHRKATIEVLRLFDDHGDSQYGGEAVSQREHALQAAFFAEQAGAEPALIAAALLHDVGHLLHELPADAPDHGVDDEHEKLAADWLTQRFVRKVVEPVALHVAAKRYLCAVDPQYLRQLSPPSTLSLKLQGGPMTKDEASRFEGRPGLADALLLRHWDDAAKVPDLKTPDLDHFATYLDAACREERP